MSIARLLGRRHGAEGTDRVVCLLKSPPYGLHGARRPLPYRIDLLNEHGYLLRWSDDDRRALLDRVIRRLERLTTPFSQAWRTRRIRRDAFVTLAMFESEAHGLAMWRRLSRRRTPPLVVVACWLTQLATASDSRRRVYRLLYRSVDRVVVFSANQVPILTATLGILPERVTTVRFGVDLSELDGIDVSDDGHTVVAIGRDLGRDWETLAAAARGTGWNVELVTRPEQVAHIDLPTEVRLRPPVDRAVYLDLLAHASVVVVPTDVRAYPSGQTVLLEAMALGKPCVATATPAMREYLVDEQTALTVAPKDPAALRRAVQRLLDDDELRASLGARARKTEHGHGGADAMWAALAGIIDAVHNDERRVSVIS